MINKRAYRQVYDLHNTALAKVEEAPVETFWRWYWDQAGAICEANGNDAFVVDLIVAVALDVERRQRTGSNENEERSSKSA